MPRDPALEDLRLYDDAGNEMPYLIERPVPDRRSRAERKIISGFAERRHNTVITLETGLAQPLDGVTLETPANDFIKAVRVESSDDGNRWQMLAQGQPIFRQPYGASHLQISFPAGASPWLRLTVDDQRSQPIPFTGRARPCGHGRACARANGFRPRSPSATKTPEKRGWR